MSSSEKKTVTKKTKTLSIKRIPESATLITIAQACQSFINDLKGIRIVKFKSDDSRNAMLDFITSKQCESAKELGEIKIGKESFQLNYARSSDSLSYDMVASENKLYVKYPEGSNEQDIIKMLGNITISKPETAHNFFFAICKDIDQQCNLVKNFDKKKVGNGELTVKVAIDKKRKGRSLRATSN